ncbi:hypothetical protein N7474_006884 [Penicillium riverlandense]|uniref:uncharacterized protein n=1 Tax=Penicillium riverlandense TaxID=1903569 RepID=UPI002547B172|nr:uncharacterized protein N7474_006884 [Penicillium riverlandense]KAJ5815107.1 hypothetical protein N7474_006884 [Penicillium riverlandense]
MTTATTQSVTDARLIPSTLQSKKPVPYPTRKSIPAVWMRSGTSKGLFIHRKDLPASIEQWEPILLSAMGSSQGNARQIDGVGGATSTTSKVAVVAKSHRPDIDVEYTFIQVAPDRAKVDMTGNCGNIASGIGPFALDEGIVHANLGQTEMDVRILNTNTGQNIVETIQVSPDGSFREDGNCYIAGVEGTASPIKVAFLNPGGSMTGRMFPTGETRNTLTIQSRIVGSFKVRVSLVDAANPFVLVDSRSLPRSWPDPGDPDFISVAEDIRREGAVQFGLAQDIQSAGLVQGTPKIAFLSPPADGTNADIEVLAFTMGKPHASLQLTGAVCIGAAMAIHGTVAWDLDRDGKDNQLPKYGMEIEDQKLAPARPVAIRHPAGIIDTETVLGMARSGEVSVKKVGVFRTARRLFEGNVFYKD